MTGGERVLLAGNKRVDANTIIINVDV